MCIPIHLNPFVYKTSFCEHSKLYIDIHSIDFSDLFASLIEASAFY